MFTKLMLLSQAEFHLLFNLRRLNLSIVSNLWRWMSKWPSIRKISLESELSEIENWNFTTIYLIIKLREILKFCKKKLCLWMTELDRKLCHCLKRNIIIIMEIKYRNLMSKIVLIRNKRKLSSLKTLWKRQLLNRLFTPTLNILIITEAEIIRQKEMETILSVISFTLWVSESVRQIIVPKNYHLLTSTSRIFNLLQALDSHLCKVNLIQGQNFR